MSKLKSRKDVIEWYWIDYLTYCQSTQESTIKELSKTPTISGFWQWYINEGALGLKRRGLFYTKKDINYV